MRVELIEQACVKRYSVNNWEREPAKLNAEIDKQTLHETCLPPFEAAIRDGHVASRCGI